MLKSIQFFPFLAFTQSRFARPAELPAQFQAKATVDEAIGPEGKGRVRFQGSYWPAQCDRAISLLPGQICQVVGRCGLTLIVKPAND